MSSATRVRQSDVPRIMRYRRVQNGNTVSRRGLVAAEYDPSTKTFRVGYSLCRLTDRFDTATAINIAKTRMDRNDSVTVGDGERINRLRRSYPFVLRDTLEDVLSTIQHIHDNADRPARTTNSKKTIKRPRRK